MARVHKKKLEAALWKLLDYSQELGVSVEFTDSRVGDALDDGLHGTFDPSMKHIVVNKYIEDALSTRHIHTLAHELRHAYQFKTGMWPTIWLGYIGVYPKYSNSQQNEALEADADQWANEFLVKNKIPILASEKTTSQPESSQ